MANISEKNREASQMVRIRGEIDTVRCGNEKMEVSGRRKIGTEVERCYTKRHEGERSTERSTRPENKNLMRRPQ